MNLGVRVSDLTVMLNPPELNLGGNTHTQKNDLREDDVGQLCFDRRI